MAMRRCRNRSKDLIHGKRWWSYPWYDVVRVCVFTSIVGFGLAESLPAPIVMWTIRHTLPLMAGRLTTTWKMGLGTFTCRDFSLSVKLYVFMPRRPSGPWNPRSSNFEISFRNTIFWKSDRPFPDTSTWHKTHETDIHASGGIRTRNPSKWSAVNPRPRPRGHWDRLSEKLNFP